MTSPDSNPYSSARIAKGLKHLLLGKGLTSAAGIGTLLLVVRGLDLQAFAAYSVLLGLVEMVSAITNVGTGQIITRFVPEIYAKGYHRALRRLVTGLLAMRYAVLVLAVLLLYGMMATVAGWIGLEAWLDAFRLYLLVVIFRTVTSTVFQVLEAMLHQGAGQAVLATVTASRFVFVAIAYGTGNLDLQTLILIEIATDVIGAVLMLWTLRRVAAGAREDTEGEAGWIAANRQRMLSFGVKGYLQHLIIMPFSGVANRLVVGGQLAAAQVALFGFAQSIFDLMQRFLPAQLFVGLVRPVLAARYASNRGFEELQFVINQVLKVNLALIGLALAVVIGGGGDMLLAITAGKYGEQAVALLALMCLLIALESWRHVLDLLSHTVERYGMLVFSNGVLGSSLLLGIALIPSIGVFALPAANCVGLLVSNLIVVYWLHATGFPFRHDLRAVAGIAGAVGLAFGAVQLLHHAVDHWLVLALIAMAVYGGACFLVLRPRGAERELWSKMVTDRG